MNLLLKLTKRRPHIVVHLIAPRAAHDHRPPRYPWVSIVGANGETMLHSETYAYADGARDAAKNLAALTGWAVKEVQR